MANSGAPLDVAQLVADHHEVLYRYAYRLTGTAADAEDLTQQTFLVAHQKLAQLRQVDSIRGWLFTILRNGYLKSQRRQVPMLMVNEELEIHALPDEALAEQIDSEQLQAAIKTLSDEFKIVVLMFYFEHHSYRAIAELLDLPVGTVMSRLARAKAHLRRGLSTLLESDVTFQHKPVAARLAIPQFQRPGVRQRQLKVASDSSKG